MPWHMDESQLQPSKQTSQAGWKNADRPSGSHSLKSSISTKKPLKEPVLWLQSIVPRVWLVIQQSNFR